MVVAGKAGQELATGLVVPVEYQLASGETLPSTVTFLNQSTNPNQPTVIEIKLVHQHGRVTEAQTRQIKVHYIYGAGEHAGQQAADDAILNIYYTRTGQGDLVTGKVSDDLTTAPWLFDDTYNDDGYRNGYKVVAGRWTNLPTSWDSVKADVPTIAGYQAILNGDWTIHRNGQPTSEPANVFVHPSYNHPGTTIEQENSIAYTDKANEYEAMPVHTIYYVPTEQTEMRTVKKYYMIYHEDGTYTDANLVTSPDGTKQSYGELGIYFSRLARGFTTHGSTNPAQWEVSYSNWAWDSSLGDHGFKAISGSWSPWGHQQVIAMPTLDGYTTVALSADGKQANNTGDPVDQSQDIFTNDTAGDWLFRNRTTIFYVPSKLLSKTVIRTIKTTDPVTGAVTPVEQKVTFTRQARINHQDTGIILGGLNRDTGDFVTGDDIWDHWSTDQDGIPTGTWQRTDVAKPGYTALVDGTVSSQVDEQPVTPRTADTTVTVTYIKNAGTITISHDEVDQTYTGQVATIPSGITHAINKADSRLTWPSGAENVQLESTDFSFADENGRLIDAPSNVGTYHIVLNAHGLAKFQDLDQNFAWQYDPKKSYVVLKITQAQASASLAGHGEKTYNGQAVSDADIQKQDANNNIKVNFAIPGDSHQITITLAAQDFDWNGSESVPSDVATYHLTLNDQGKSAIKKLFVDNRNIKWTDASFTGSATYTITPAMSKVVLSGQSSKVYSGAAIKVDDINHDGSIKVTLTTNGLDPITYTLQAGDYNWLDKNGNDIAAPINAGKYYIRLKSDSLTHLQGALNTRHGNVVLDPTLEDSGQAEFDITPAARVVVHYQDVDGMTKGVTGWHGAVGTHLTHDQIIDGLPNAGFAFDPTTGNWDYSNDHYVLDSQSGVSAFPSSGQLSSDGNYYLGDYYIYLKHGTHTVPFDKPADKDGLRDTDLNSSVSRKITVNMPKTTPTVIKQTVRFVRNATVDEVNGQITYGDWQVSGNTDLPAYQAPEVNGYTARPASVAKIFPKLGQKVIDVIINYAANKQIVDINFVDDDNNGSQVGPTITKTGVTDQTITDFGDVQVPTNYQLAHGQILPTRYQFTAYKDQTITIHLIHQTEIVDGKDQCKIPAGVDVNQLIHMARRTINDNLPSGTQTTKQTATITRTATYDKVTGKLSHFSDWTKASWEAYTPTVPAGYTASQSIVSSEAITADTKDTTVDISYNAVASAKLTGNGFSDYTGTQISFNDLNDPAHGLKIIVTGPTAHIGTLPLKQGEIEFSMDGQHWMTTLPTNAAKYQVRLTQQGIDAIKAKYGNNSISWIDGSGNSTITSDASYTINPVEFAVTITGYQKALRVSDFSDTNYQVSAGLLDSSHLLMLLQSRQAALSDLVVPEGLTYQIIGEDGEKFTPTTPGEYDVALTPAGLRLLQQANPNYRFKVYTKAKFALDALSLVKDTKIVTETIHYRYADGSQALPDRRATITYTRHGEKDALTGEIAWEAWTPDNNQTFPAVVTPAIAGYTADQTEIEAQEVTENSGDLEFTVIYQKNQQPVQPVNPVHPANPNPGKPTLPAQPGHKGQPLPGDPGYTIKTNGEIVGSNGKIAKHGQLPQTGNNVNDRSLLGLVALSLTGLLGLGGLKKKRDNQ